MSEKATLLTPISPAGNSKPAQQQSLLTSIDDAQPSPKVGSLLNRVDDATFEAQNGGLLKPAGGSESLLSKAAAQAAPVETGVLAPVVANGTVASTVTEAAPSDSGAPIGIYVGVAVVLCLVVGGVVMFARKPKKSAASVQATSSKTAAPVTAPPEVAVEAPQSPVVEFNAAAKPAARSLPPRKLSAPGGTPVAPRKPGGAPVGGEAASAPNAPSRIKAPSKPKKRF